MSNLYFDFPYHTQRTAYPDSTIHVQMGKGWVYPIKPNAPDQRIITLTFPGMQYFVNPTTGLVDHSVNSQRNLAALEDFYQQVLGWDTFTYSHPVYGAMTVRFNKPLQPGQGIPNGNGLVQAFDVELIEVP
jgi:hypothetical protein